MGINWTKKFSSADNGSVLSGTQVGTIQDDIDASLGTANQWANVILLSKTADYTAVNGDAGKLILYNSSSNLTLTLPDIAGGAVFHIKNIGTGTLTIAAHVTDTIEEDELFQYDCMTLYGDSVSNVWRVLSKYKSYR